ncbi:MarR family transcriptional regulator [Cohnella lubricantis]|uniref:MarR family transcriptional regulator n=2 Tax=Cohnella lubricantis TaxID=2163172 RepID=A0A841TIZ0_9BACL|nr:MarR family transcriptional regulator [Cohnella lubricantis]
MLIRRATSFSNDKRLGRMDRSAYLLLNRIISSAHIGVRALADEFHLDISTVSRQIAALEQKGYVKRNPDPSDGRAFFFEVTESGRRDLMDYKQARLARITDRLKGWTGEERDRFAELLRKFNRTLDEQSD